MSGSGFSSNNPFRRKLNSASDALQSASTYSGDAGTSAHSQSFDRLDALPPLAATEFFRSQLEAIPHSTEPPPSTSFQKRKVVKKVRVQSPPPSSPDSIASEADIGPFHNVGARMEGEAELNDDDSLGAQFSRSQPGLSLSGGVQSGSTPQPHVAQPPPNPFQRTLGDIEPEFSPASDMHAAGPVTKGSLDVETFKNLLLTGSSGISGIAVESQSTFLQVSGSDGTSTTDASSVSKQSLNDSSQIQETPRTSHEVSEPEVEDDRSGLVNHASGRSKEQPSTQRKKPQPPSSRHGKAIKVDAEDQKAEEIGRFFPKGGTAPASSSDSHSEPDSLPRPSPHRRQSSMLSDVNKPLPPALAVDAVNNDSENVFEQEAAGKVPEPADTDDEMGPDLPPPRAPTPPNASHARNTQTGDAQQARKPAPPPRRNLHARGESKTYVAARPSPITIGPAVSQEQQDFDRARRSSVDSTRSRSSSLRVSVHGPVPPPPRRQNHGSSRQSTSFASPSAPSFASGTSSHGVPSPSLSETGPSSTRHFTGSEAVIKPSAGIDVHLPPASPSIAPESSSSHVPTVSSGDLPNSVAAKPSRPPPPPARNSSVRSSGTGRPRSAGGRIPKVSSSTTSTGPPPPPPPKRSRAGSKDSNDTPSFGQVGRASTESTRYLGGAVIEEPTAEDFGGSDARQEHLSMETDAVPSAANDILADLDALRREVDALRGQYEKTGV
ncbi:hypothetical protein VTK73DRAFT_9443 [Phialemonium thermophilum]|uniref:Uncharacterized protein n=1 Tax=Phialemonium thermophilum TaxID=223376 RepID=A0ABR3XKZ0_9PEZI